jgi:hypothetical protein
MSDKAGFGCLTLVQREWKEQSNLVASGCECVLHHRIKISCGNSSTLRYATSKHIFYVLYDIVVVPGVNMTIESIYIPPQLTTARVR